jgi:hypothetical protein
MVSREGDEESIRWKTKEVRVRVEGEKRGWRRKVIPSLRGHQKRGPVVSGGKTEGSENDKGKKG